MKSVFLGSARLEDDGVIVREVVAIAEAQKMASGTEVEITHEEILIEDGQLLYYDFPDCPYADRLKNSSMNRKEDDERN